VEVPRPDEDDVHVAVDERPLLGRDAELRELAGVLADAAQHRGRVVLVTGEAGIGKTGLTEETVRAGGRRWLRRSVGSLLADGHASVLAVGPGAPDPVRHRRAAGEQAVPLERRAAGLGGGGDRVTRSQ
jgi:hypothetical protein